MVMNTQKLPPHNVELEKAVLGAIMLEKDALLEVVDLLTPDTFYNYQHKKIYQYGILPLYRENKPIDILTVTQKLEEHNSLSKELSPYFITQLTNRVSSGTNIKEHVLILKQEAIKRSLIQFCSSTLQKSYRKDVDSLILLDHAARELDQIGVQITSSTFSKIDEIIKANIQEIQEAGNNDREITGIASGFYELDRMTAGWQKSDLIILAARPGMGKSTLALNMVEFAAIEFNKKIAFFSLEMSKQQLGKKSISSQSALDLSKLRIGKLDSKDWQTLHKGICELVEANIFRDDQAAISVFEMKTKLRRLKHEHPDLAMVVVDYLQLMNGNDPDNKSQNREQQISYISRSLKGIAKELDLPVIALSQLSRSVESRGGDKKPMLSDLRESGAIEQDADIVTFLYRPEYYGLIEDAEGNDIRGQAQLIISKHRNGSLGEVKLGFYGKRSKFVSIQEFYSGNTV